MLKAVSIHDCQNIKKFKADLSLVYLCSSGVCVCVCVKLVITNPLIAQKVRLSVSLGGRFQNQCLFEF